MKIYGLIGYPLGHSFSKKYFTEKFKQEGLPDNSYELFAIPSITEFPSLLNLHPFLKGLNVTIPYKEQILKYVTEQTKSVKKIGAANTIKFINNRIIAYNTDIVGFEKSFIKKLKPSHKKALILGTGGSSKAVQFVLQKLNIEYLIVTRHETDATVMINYSKIDAAIINDHTIIINCTPVGMYPDEEISPALNYQLLTPHHYLFDLVYNPAKTMFLKKGEDAGAATQNGYEMLVMQAEESWKIWNED